MKKIIVLLLALVLAACGSSGDKETEEPPLPTRFEAVTTEIPTEEATNEPAVVATNTPLTRPTLPPSWTPEPEATATPTSLPPTATALIPAPGGADPNQSDACLNYRVDFDVATREFRLGESPTIAWTPVDGVGLYRVYIRDEFENQVYFDLITETSVVVPPETFSSTGTYGWSVEPLDTVGIQICTARGGEFRATS